jgi:hypothetical protein
MLSFTLDKYPKGVVFACSSVLYVKTAFATLLCSILSHCIKRPAKGMSPSGPFMDWLSARRLRWVWWASVKHNIVFGVRLYVLSLVAIILPRCSPNYDAGCHGFSILQVMLVRHATGYPWSAGINKRCLMLKFRFLLGVAYMDCHFSGLLCS